MTNEKSIEKVLLSKEIILKGRDKTTWVRIEELGGEIEIRPLTEEAWSEIEAATMAKSEVISGAVFDKDGNIDKQATAKAVKMKFNMEQMTMSHFLQNVIALRYGLVEKWTEEEIKSISPPGIIDKIAKEIYKISKITEKQLEEIDFFRKE